MLKPYDKSEDIPEPLREHYSRREDGKYHADIPNDHPAVKHNAKLLSEKQTAEDKAKDLEGQLESAKAGGLPRGYVAVPKADADLLEKVKAHGSADEVVAKLAEHGDLKEKADKQAKQTRLKAIGKAMGWNEDKTVLLLENHELPDTEIRDGKVVAKVKQGDGSLVEKPFAEVVSGDEKLAALVPVLSGQTPVRPGNGRDPAPAGNLSTFEQTRKAEQERQKATAAPAGSLADRFFRRTPAQPQ